MGFEGVLLGVLGLEGWVLGGSRLVAGWGVVSVFGCWGCHNIRFLMHMVCGVGFRFSLLGDSSFGLSYLGVLCRVFAGGCGFEVLRWGWYSLSRVTGSCWCALDLQGVSL